MIPGSAWNCITVNPVQKSNLNEKMKQKTLIYMVIKPSIVLAAAVLTAASFLAPSTATAADPTYLMPTGPGGGQPDDRIQPYDPNPAARGFQDKEVFDLRVRRGRHQNPPQDPEDHGLSYGEITGRLASP
jgi:hypothetical protein